MTAYICIEETGIAYTLNTPEEITEAMEALRDAGLESAPVWVGEPDGAGDSCKNGQVLLAADLPGWKPTHKITFTNSRGEKDVDVVMLTDEGAAYTRREWATDDSAAWGVDEGHWLCEGQVTPGGENGTVEVERLAPR